MSEFPINSEKSFNARKAKARKLAYHLGHRLGKFEPVKDGKTCVGAKCVHDSCDAVAVVGWEVSEIIGSAAQDICIALQRMMRDVQTFGSANGHDFSLGFSRSLKIFPGVWQADCLTCGKESVIMPYFIRTNHPLSALCRAVPGYGAVYNQNTTQIYPCKLGV